MKTLISAEELRKRVKELGKQITEDYAGKSSLSSSFLREARFSELIFSER